MTRTAEKGLTREQAEHLEALLRPYVERFRSETQAARAMGIAQSHLNKIMRKGGCGIQTLMLLRQITGHTIDELLGLPPLPAKVERTALQQQIREAVILEMRRLQAETPEPAPQRVPPPAPSSRPRRRQE